MLTRSNGSVTSPRSTHRSVALVLGVAAAILVYACDTGGTPTSPPGSGGTTPGSGSGTPSGSVTPGVTRLCKNGPGGVFQVTVGVTAANPTTKTVTLGSGECADVATVNPASQDDVIVAVAERAVAFAALDHMARS
jgi:hypothetical protein